MKRIGTFLIAVALVVGMVGCGDGNGNGNGNDNGDGNGNGTVSYQLTVSSTSGGAVVEPGEGVHVYDQGSVVELVASPASGYRFVNWTGDVDTVTNVGSASTTVTMNGDYSVRANFTEMLQYDLTISSTSGGSVTTPGEGTFTYDDGAIVRLVATRSTGYQFVNWTGDVDAVANHESRVTTITMNGDYSITANFEEEVPVYFADANLEAAIREAIGIPERTLYPSDLKELTEFWVEERNITNLSGVEHCTSLSLLHLGSNQISDISPLAGLTSLTELHLGGNQISDISPLASLTNLTHLDLVVNLISDLSPLANLASLTILALYDNEITGISPLAGLTNLTYLQLDLNEISDISPLEGLTRLTSLGLGRNQISDISPLAGLTNLTYLQLDLNEISDISPLAGLTNLTWLNLFNNQIDDIASLESLTNLTGLLLSGNKISDVKPLVDNLGLDAGEVFWLSDNPPSGQSVKEYVPALEARGESVDY